MALTLKRDPSRTTLLRRAMMREMSKRFGALKEAIEELVVTKDVFGLVPIHVNVASKAFAFETDVNKIKSFRAWLDKQVASGVLATDGISGKPWTGQYVESAYRKGLMRAYVDSNKVALLKPTDFYAGSQQQFLTMAFLQPETLSKIQLVGTRAFDKLKDVTVSMSSQMSDILASGLANGLGPAQIARELAKNVDNLTRTRAWKIARTEIIYAHAEGQLDSFALLGIEEVGLMAEWSTAGDALVCEDCDAMAGQTYKVAEAHGMIPLHPNCRCCWIPSEQTKKKQKVKRTEAVKKAPPSRMAEPVPGGKAPSRTYAERSDTYNKAPLTREQKSAFIAQHEEAKRELEKWIDSQIPNWRTAKGTDRNTVANKLYKLLSSLKEEPHTGYTSAENLETVFLNAIAKGPTVANKVRRAEAMLNDLSCKALADRFAALHGRSIHVNAFKKAMREYARPEISQIALSQESNYTSVCHELGHLFERNSAIAGKCAAWRDARAGSLLTKSLREITGRTAYAADEIARVDKYIIPYVGKVYSGSSTYTEVFSMGLQQFSSPARMLSFALKDFDHFALIVNILQGLV